MHAPTAAESNIELTLAARIKDLLESLRHPALAPFLEDWPRRPQIRPGVAVTLPVLRWLPAVAGDGAAFAKGVVAAVCHAAPSLAWRQTYTDKDLDSAFLGNYGWSEIIGGSGPLEGTRLACGFLILGPSTHYPLHHHEAEEIYLPLSGTAAWQQGDGVWREHPPGTLIHHAGGEPHAMRTAANPLLALYLWHGAGIAGKARLDDA